MRKIILFMHMSLDGYIGGSHGELDWVTMTDTAMDKELISNLLETVDTMILGRVLYQGFQSAWPAIAADPQSPKDLVDFANWIENTPKLIFSKTLTGTNWKNSKIISVKENADIVKEVEELKKQDGGDIVLFGGTQTAQTFADLDLIDEYRFKLEPIALGAGKVLFKNKKPLKLVSSKAYSSGVITLSYSK
jgi:dihydrofolate reductase